MNTCSGALVEPVALKLALSDGMLGGAALDAPEGETWLEAWVRDVPNLLITPRTAFYSDQARGGPGPSRPPRPPLPAPRRPGEPLQRWKATYDRRCKGEK